MSMLRPGIVLLLLLTLITGGVYPLLTTLLGQWWFADSAAGSLIYQNNALRGSRLIGQDFTQPGYFQGRPSATAETPYNPESSGGSNLAASNPALDTLIAERVAALRAANPHASQTVPVDLVTASASGLDYGISPEAAKWQIPRVAAARHLSVESVTRLMEAHTFTPLPGFVGKPIVNVLELNLALDANKD